MCLSFLLTAGLIISINYIKDFSWSNAIIAGLDFYIPIACTILLLSFLMPSSYTYAQLFNIGFLYSIIVIAGIFGTKEILLPKIKPQQNIQSQQINTPYAIVLKEFESVSTLPSKKGLILKNQELCFVFGTATQQNPNSYLLQNVFFKATNGVSLFSDYAKIIDNQIVLYKAVIFQENNTKKSLPKNYLLPLPFDMRSFFNIWNNNDPKHIELLPVISNNMFNNAMLPTILTAFMYYIVGFITLLSICIIATSFGNTLKFTPTGMIGILAIIIVSYPFVLLFHEYINLLATICLNIII